MSQNVYDDPAFFAGYSALPRSVGGLAEAPEWPDLRAMLPDLAGARVLDLGCGFGWFSRWAADQGATSVVGVDLSANMLARAERDTAAGDASTVVEYRRADLESFDPAAPEASPAASPGAYDLAYSSLTLHYVVDLAGLLERVHDALAPGSSLVCSVEHPVFTAPSEPGFVVGADGRISWPLDGYLDEGPRATDWLAEGVVKQHRTLATYVRLLVDTGFTLDHLVEWGPSEGDVAAHPEWGVERERPAFLLLGARRG